MVINANPEKGKGLSCARPETLREPHVRRQLDSSWKRMGNHAKGREWAKHPQPSNSICKMRPRLTVSIF